MCVGRMFLKAMIFLSATICTYAHCEGLTQSDTIILDGEVIHGTDNQFTCTYNFGTVRQNSILQKTFVLESSASNSIVITEARATCSCTVPNVIRGSRLEPGGSLQIPVSLDIRKRKPGHLTQSVTLMTDGPAIVVIRLAANIANEYPYFLDFGAVKADGSMTREIVIRPWQGESSFAIERITSDCESVKTSVLPPKADGCIPVQIRFEGGTPGQKVNCTLVIHTNETEVPEKLVGILGHFMNVLEASETRVNFGVVTGSQPVEHRLNVSAPYDVEFPTLSITQNDGRAFTVQLSKSPEPNCAELLVKLEPSQFDSGLLRDTIILTASSGFQLRLPVYALVRTDISQTPENSKQ